MKLFVTGGNGQLGKALQSISPDSTYTDVDELDITDVKAIEAVNWNEYDAVVNAAAFTAVDKAEEMVDLAWKVNVMGPALLADASRRAEIPLVHVSSDYVYDGQTDNHLENELLKPLSVYGSSKAAGDIAAAQNPKHYIIRSSWVVGDGPNFVRTMLELGKTKDELSIVNDQIGRLTFADELALSIRHLLDKTPAFGTYHMSNTGESTHWAGVAREIFKYANMKVNVKETTTTEFAKGKSPFAPRPRFSTLNLEKLTSTGFQASDWKDALKDYITKELA